MRLKQIFTRKKQDKAAPNSTGLQNPYVSGAEARQEWDDRYHRMAKVIRNWQAAFLFAMGLSLILALTLYKKVTESTIKPFVVESCQGMPLALLPTVSGSPHKDSLVNYAINQFIINARTILHDNTAEKALLSKVYAFSADNTLSFLHDFYQEHDPFEEASRYTTTVTLLNSPLPISSDTFQVTWDETKKNPVSEGVISTTRWSAMVKVRWGESNPKFITDNPFGIYITQVTWSPLPG